MKHRNVNGLLVALVCAAFFALAIAGVCGGVYSRSVVTLARIAGTATFTNAQVQTSARVMEINVADCYNATDTITVQRITSDGAFSNVVALIPVRGYAGRSSISNSWALTALKYGDTLTFASSCPTGSTITIEYELEQF